MVSRLRDDPLFIFVLLGVLGMLFFTSTGLLLVFA